MRFYVSILSIILATMHCVGETPQEIDSPATKKQPVTENYHGTTVKEDYRWLEDFQDSAVRQWSAAQNNHAHSVLDALPGVDAIRSQVTEILRRSDGQLRHGDSSWWQVLCDQESTAQTAIVHHRHGFARRCRYGPGHRRSQRD